MCQAWTIALHDTIHLERPNLLHGFSMESLKDELNEELQHEQKMLKLRRRNLRLLEEQEAALGLHVPTPIKAEIADLKESIRDHQKRIEELQTKLSENGQPIAEIEYQMHVAEVWDSVDAFPKFAHLYRLDFMRMKLGITPERADELEMDVRKFLAVELELKIMANMQFRVEFERMIKWICDDTPSASIRALEFKESVMLSPFWRMTILDPEKGLFYLLNYEPRQKDKYSVNKIHRIFPKQAFILSKDADHMEKLLVNTVGEFDMNSFKSEARIIIDELFPE